MKGFGRKTKFIGDCSEKRRVLGEEIDGGFVEFIAEIYHLMKRLRFRIIYYRLGKYEINIINCLGNFLI